jgi:hypothetical protein
MWLLLLLLLLLGLLWALFMYFKRRYHAQDDKMKALQDMAALDHNNEIVPEDGDVVEWGHNYNKDQFGMEEKTGDEEVSTANNQNKTRKSDLFVI